MFNSKEIVKDKVYFEGEFYDAFSFLFDIISKEKNLKTTISNK
jgi:hypothetical protein